MMGDHKFWLETLSLGIRIHLIFRPQNCYQLRWLFIVFLEPNYGLELESISWLCLGIGIYFIFCFIIYVIRIWLPPGRKCPQPNKLFLPLFRTPPKTLDPIAWLCLGIGIYFIFCFIIYVIRIWLPPGRKCPQPNKLFLPLLRTPPKTLDPIALGTSWIVCLPPSLISVRQAYIPGPNKRVIM